MDVALLRAMLTFSAEACVVLSRALGIVAANDRAQKQLGLIEGESIETLFVLQPADRQTLGACFSATTERRFALLQHDGTQMVVSGWRVSGPFREHDLIALRLETRAELQKGYSALDEEVHAHRKRSQRLYLQNMRLTMENQDLIEQTKTDTMTGLLNTPALRRRMHEMAEEDLPFGLLYLDMNGLKRINDTYGHAAGDAAILRVSQAISSSIRGQDAGARLGGDEFAVLVTGLNSNVFLRALGERILRFMKDAEHPEVSDDPLNLTAAIGIARWPDDTTSIDKIEKLADRAMYVSKRSGATVVFAQAL